MGQAQRSDLEALYRARHVAFRNALVGVAGSVDAGDDAMQEGFARALVNIEQFRGEGTLEAWVWRICLNEARGRRRRAPVEAALDNDVADLLPAAERDFELMGAIRALSPRRRLVVFLRYFADMSYDEIAEATAMRPGTVAATLGKARRELARHLNAREMAR